MKVQSFCIALIFFAGLSVLVSGCSGQPKPKSGEQKQRELILKNKIKKITECQIAVLLGVKQNEQINDIKFFNDKGLLEKENNYTNGEVDLIKTFTYDSKDNLVLLTAVSKDSTLMFKETNTYDKNNNKIEHYHYLPDGTFKYKNISSYDTKNRIKELDWYWPIGFVSKNIYSYQGINKITDTEYSANGKETYHWLYKYDSKNNITEAAQYYPGNKLTEKIIYEYNQQSQLIKQRPFVIFL